ncbi:MAG: hypothetical protein ACLVJ6_01620 [Merdibacter sp.]
MTFGLLIELKPGEGEAIKMVDALMAAIEDSRFEDRVIFMSMDYDHHLSAAFAPTVVDRLLHLWFPGKIDQNLNVDFLAIESQVNTLSGTGSQQRHPGLYLDGQRYVFHAQLSAYGVSSIIGDNVRISARAWIRTCTMTKRITSMGNRLSALKRGSFPPLYSDRSTVPFLRNPRLPLPAKHAVLPSRVRPPLAADDDDGDNPRKERRAKARPTRRAPVLFRPDVRSADRSPLPAGDLTDDRQHQIRKESSICNISLLSL